MFKVYKGLKKHKQTINYLLHNTVYKDINTSKSIWQYFVFDGMNNWLCSDRVRFESLIKDQHLMCNTVTSKRGSMVLSQLQLQGPRLHPELELSMQGITCSPAVHVGFYLVCQTVLFLEMRWTDYFSFHYSSFSLILKIVNVNVAVILNLYLNGNKMASHTGCIFAL